MIVCYRPTKVKNDVFFSKYAQCSDRSFCIPEFFLFLEGGRGLPILLCDRAVLSLKPKIVNRVVTGFIIHVLLGCFVLITFRHLFSIWLQYKLIHCTHFCIFALNPLIHFQPRHFFTIYDAMQVYFYIEQLKLFG